MFRFSNTLVVTTVLFLLGAFNVVLAANSVGCGKTSSSITNGTNMITVNGKSRQFIVRIPIGYQNSKPHKLIFGFHWVGGSMTDVATGRTVQTGVWDYYGLRRLANESAIFVAPQGLNNGWANSGGEDIAFTDSMINEVQTNLCVDTKQIYATGFSYGASMTFSVACSRATTFRAVAVLSGGQLSGCSGGNNPIPYLGIHGIRDGTLNIAGGRTLRDRFIKNNGCTSMSPKEPTQGSLTHIGTSYTGCKAGYPVRWVAFDEGHIAAPRDGATGDSGSATFSPGETWNFWSQFF